MTIRRALVQNAGVLQEITTGDKLYGVVPVGTGIRITLYVRTDGSNSNDGSANDAAHAFLTPQGAYDYFIQNYNWAGQADQTVGTHVLKIKLGNTGAFGILIHYAPCYITVEGDTVTSANTTIDQISCFVGSCTAQNLKFKNLVTGGTLSYAYGAQQAASCELGNGVIFDSGYNYHMIAWYGAVMFTYVGYTISAGTAQSHIGVYGGSTVEGGSVTVTLTGTPVFTNYFIQADVCGAVFLSNMIYSGAATCKRFEASILGAIYTGSNNLNYFPGSTDGILYAFSNYDDYTNETLPTLWANRFVIGGPSIQSISDYGVNLQVKFDGTRNLPNGVQVLYRAIDQTVGAVTTEVTLATITIPDKLLGLNSTVRLRMVGEHTNNANNKTWKIKWDAAGTPVNAVNLTTTTTGVIAADVLIQNKNSISFQRVHGFLSGAAHAITTATKNTDTSVTTITVTAQKAVSGDVMTMDYVIVEVLP
jgi:hypothetical protein